MELQANDPVVEAFIILLSIIKVKKKITIIQPIISEH